MAMYSGAEIFQIAMELEESGRVFYETLAETSSDEEVVNLCRNLAMQESNHFRAFKSMGEALV